VAAGASGGAVVSWQWHRHGNSGDEWLRQPHNLVAPTARVGKRKTAAAGEGGSCGAAALPVAYPVVRGSYSGLVVTMGGQR